MFLSINSIKISGEPVPLETVEISALHKELIRASWRVILAELGQTLCYVGGPQVQTYQKELPQNGSGRTVSTSPSADVSAAFIRLFEEYPRSKEFFTQFKGTPIAEIQSDPKLSKALQEHSVRVFQLVEKVIGRMEPTIEKV